MRRLDSGGHHVEGTVLGSTEAVGEATNGFQSLTKRERLLLVLSSLCERCPCLSPIADFGKS